MPSRLPDTWSECLRGLPLQNSTNSRHQAVPLLAGKGNDDHLELGTKECETLPSAQRLPSTEVELTHILDTASPVLTRSKATNDVLPILLAVLHPVWSVIRPSIFLDISHKKHLHLTAWLDGLRGIAAFFVVFAHAGNVFYPWQRHGWTSENPHFFELPMVRIFYSGASMVSIFLVISGYAVSFKPLLLVEKGDTSKVFDSLASSTFRRGLRLFMPCAAIAFLCAWVDHCSIYDPAWQNQDHREDTMLDTLRWWFNAVVLGIDPFRTNHKRPWDTPLSGVEQTMWTIPIEYRGSLVVFVLILILAKTRRSMRLSTLAVYLLFLTFVGQWDILLFVSGMLCCEVHHMSRGITTHDLLDRPVTIKRPTVLCRQANSAWPCHMSA